MAGIVVAGFPCIGVVVEAEGVTVGPMVHVLDNDGFGGIVVGSYAGKAPALAANVTIRGSSAAGNSSGGGIDTVGTRGDGTAAVLVAGNRRFGLLLLSPGARVWSTVLGLGIDSVLAPNGYEGAHPTLFGGTPSTGAIIGGHPGLGNAVVIGMHKVSTRIDSNTKGAVTVGGSKPPPSRAA